MVWKLRRRLNRALGGLKKPDPRKVHFLHIGKTGGTAIRAALSDLHSTDAYDLELHKHKVTLRDIPRGEKVVVFLRDPLSRFVSGFHSRKAKGQPRYQSQWSATEEQVFSVFATPNDLALALADAESSEHDLAVRAMYEVKHLVRYRKWLVSEDYLEDRQQDLFFVGFQETLDDDFARLADRLGLPPTVALPRDDVVAYRSPANQDRSLSEAARACLASWYAEDYRLIAACQRLAPH